MDSQVIALLLAIGSIIIVVLLAYLFASLRSPQKRKNISEDEKHTILNRYKKKLESGIKIAMRFTTPGSNREALTDKIENFFTAFQNGIAKSAGLSIADINIRDIYPDTHASVAHPIMVNIAVRVRKDDYEFALSIHTLSPAKRFIHKGMITIYLKSVNKNSLRDDFATQCFEFIKAVANL